jgi:hypothetical protein
MQYARFKTITLSSAYSELWSTGAAKCGSVPLQYVCALIAHQLCSKLPGQLLLINIKPNAHHVASSGWRTP